MASKVDNIYKISVNGTIFFILLNASNEAIEYVIVPKIKKGTNAFRILIKYLPRNFDLTTKSGNK